MEALEFKHWILGVGLDSDEKGHPPAEFAHVFARARREGFLITMHCDVDQQNSAEHIRPGDLRDRRLGSRLTRQAPPNT